MRDLEPLLATGTRERKDFIKYRTCDRPRERCRNTALEGSSTRSCDQQMNDYITHENPLSLTALESLRVSTPSTRCYNLVDRYWFACVHAVEFFPMLRIHTLA